MLVQTGFQGCWLFELTVLSLISHALRITSMDAFQVTHQVGLLALLVCACRLCRAVGPARLRLPPASCSLPPWCLPHAPPLDPPEHAQGGGKKGQRRFGCPASASPGSPCSSNLCGSSFTEVGGGNSDRDGSCGRWTYAKAFSPPSPPYCNMVDGGNRRSKLPLLPLVPPVVRKA